VTHILDVRTQHHDINVEAVHGSVNVGSDRVIERAFSREWQMYFTPRRNLSIITDLSYDCRVRRAILGLLSTGSCVLDLVRSCGDRLPPDLSSCGFVACGR